MTGPSEKVSFVFPFTNCFPRDQSVKCVLFPCQAKVYLAREYSRLSSLPAGTGKGLRTCELSKILPSSIMVQALQWYAV